MQPIHQNRQIPVYLPWSFKSYPNGFHPLLDGLIAESDEVRWLAPETEMHPIQRANKLFMSNLNAMRSLRSSASSDLQEDQIAEFLLSRKSEIFMRRPDRSRLTFHHTSPWTNGDAPFVLHIENPVTLFSPYLVHGANERGTPVATTYYFQLVRALLESPNCRAIFTHIQATKDCLASLFRGTSIPGKSHYIPLGVPVSPERIGDARNEVRILFTNSHHGETRSFHIRGGVSVVLAFLEAAKTHENLRLDLYSKLPSDLDESLVRTIRNHPGIKLVEDHVSEEEILLAFSRCDVLALPSLGLHSMSALRGMAAGALCIVSDAPGYSEFITDGETGIVIDGIAARTYFQAPDCQLTLDNYDWVFSGTNLFAEQLTGIFSRIGKNPACFDSIRERAKRHVTEERKPSTWRRSFLDLLKKVESGEEHAIEPDLATPR